MVEKRAAERAHEEIVAQGEFARDLPQPKVGGIVRIIAHDERATVAPRNEAVIAAAVDLQLLGVKGVDQVAGDQPMRQGVDLGRRERERRSEERRVGKEGVSTVRLRWSRGTK